MGFGGCLCPGEKLTDGKESGNGENLLASCQPGLRTNTGAFQESCPDAKEFRLEQWSRVSP